MTRFGACSSRLQARRARSTSARESLRRRRARQLGSISSSPTSRRRAQSSSARGVDVSEVFHRTAVGGPPVSGPHPARRSYSSFATFKDPDGNGWLLQEITARFPGRVDGNGTTFTSSTELAAALWRAAACAWRAREADRRQVRRELASTGTPSTWWRSRPANRCRYKAAARAQREHSGDRPR